MLVNMRLLKWITYWLVTYVFLSSIPVIYAQNYANANYYLIDSLDLTQLKNRDRKVVDSALQIFHSEVHDTSKIKALNYIVETSWNDQIWIPYNEYILNYTKNELNKKSYSIHKSTNETIKNRWLYYHAQALNNRGYMHKDRGELNYAFTHYQEALHIMTKINHLKGMASVLNNIGSIYDDQGNDKKAIEYYLKSLRIKEKLKNKKSLAITLNNIGFLYHLQNGNEEALKFYEQSLQLRKAIKDTFGISNSLNNIGYLFKKQGQYNKALSYYTQSYKLREQINDKIGLISTLINIGSIHEAQKELDKALNHYLQALSISRDIKSKPKLASAINNVALIYYKQKQYKKAKTYALEGLEISKQIGFPKKIRSSASLLSKIYEKEESWKKAYHMKQLYSIMHDSIKNVETEKDIIKQRSKFELEKKQQEITLLSTQNEVQALKLDRNKLLITFFTIALFFAIIVAIISYKAYQNKKVINVLLKNQKEAISQKNEEKKAMLKEIHHRVKNNLQAVNSLLKLQSREIDDDNILAMFKEAQNRVVSMALLHEKFYRTDDLKHIKIQDHITLLIHDLLKTYNINSTIRLNLLIQSIPMGIKTLVPLGLIINEIISNALKYAFINQAEGEIKVHISSLEKRQFKMIIGDDGSGLPQEMENSGLGSKLIKTFTKQLNGTMEILDGPGTNYKFTFDIIDE